MDVKKKKKKQQPPCTGGPKLVHSPICTYGKGKKKIFILFWFWSNCGPMNLKWTSMTVQLFSFKIGNRITNKIGHFQYNLMYNIICCKKNLHKWKLIRTHLYHNQNEIQIFIFLHFLRVSMGGMQTFQTPCTGGVTVNWFQKFYHLWHCPVILHILKLGK